MQDVGSLGMLLLESGPQRGAHLCARLALTAMFWLRNMIVVHNLSAQGRRVLLHVSVGSHS